MGIKINKKDIEVLTDILVGLEKGYHIAPSDERADTLHKTICIMRKYQKIEQALNSWNMNCINDREFINTIREVVEDGKYF